MRLRPNPGPFQYQKLGAKGEDLACRFLQEKGYRIIERNIRSKLGEIDILAENNGKIIFVEVKTRKDTHFGRPEESVTEAKQKKLIQLAEWYLKSTGQTDRKTVRFDVISILWKSDKPEICHIPSAFEKQDPLP